MRISSRYQVNGAALAAAAAIEGLGFAILTGHLCQQAFRDGTLQAVRLNEELAPIELRAVYASRRELSPVVDKFLHFLESSLRNQTENQ